MTFPKSESFFQSSFRVYLRLLGYVRPYWKLFAVSILGFVIFASSQPAVAWILKYFVDGLSSDALQELFGVPFVWGLPLFIIVLAVYQGAGSFLGNYFIAKVSLGVVHDLRTALFDKLLTLSNSYFDSRKSGHLISQITYNVPMVTGAATDAIKVVFREGLTVLFLFMYLLWMNWLLTLVLIGVLPVIAMVVNTTSKKFRSQSKKIQSAMGTITHVASETIAGYRVVRGFGGETYEAQRFQKASENNRKRRLKMTRTGAVFTPTLQLITFSGMALVMFLVLLLRGDATVGELVSYITAAGLLPKPIRQLSEISATIQKGIAAAENIFEQLDEPGEPDNGTVECENVEGRLIVKDLHFRYPGTKKAALENINLHVEPGQVVALVGRSGSGKTTLSNLIPRFYQCEQGSITIDGIDIVDFRLRNLRKHISLVTQQVTLFNDTVANNIAYGCSKDTSLTEIVHAAEAAYARDFIESLPNGFDTMVGENGVLLSGGQRQRIAIARALLKNAPILILDEATSALDAESEQHIQRALDTVMRGRTVLVIAHRLSTIEKADIILVMDKGQIVERGNHSELMAMKGYYARLHDMQFQDGAE